MTKYQKEADLYDPLMSWLDEQFEYYVGGNSNWGDKPLMHKNIGPSKRCKLDVVGIKNIGAQNNSRFDEIEIIGIEVKKKDKIRSITYQHLAQAAGYKIFVHKAYIASDAEFTEEDISWAKILGIGIISIEINNRDIDFSIKLEAQYQYPNFGEMLRLLKRMSIFQCTLCSVYSFEWDTFDSETYHTYLKIKRAKHINLLRSDKDSGTRGNNYSKVEKELIIDRNLCRDCAILLGLDVPGDDEEE